MAVRQYRRQTSGPLDSYTVPVTGTVKQVAQGDDEVKPWVVPLPVTIQPQGCAVRVLSLVDGVKGLELIDGQPSQFEFLPGRRETIDLSRVYVVKQAGEADGELFVMIELPYSLPVTVQWPPGWSA